MPLNLRILLFPTLLVLFGCSSRFADLCERAADCEGGGDDEIDACIISAESDEEVASVYGCDDEFDAYYDCVDRSSSCRDDFSGENSWSTYDSSAGEDACDERRVRIATCTSPEVAP